MTIKKYNQSAVQICGDCKGDGQRWSELEPARHGSSGVCEMVVCSTCSGSGMVRVTRDITITIEPHLPKTYLKATNG